MRSPKHMISPETAPPGSKVTVPSGAVMTGANAARDDLGQAPSVTRVEGLYPISPIPWLLCSPIKARKRPIPAADDIRTGLGTSLASLARNPTAEMKRKIKPSMKMAAKALL